MPYGLYLDNQNGKRVIGSDTVAPRFIGKYTRSALDETGRFGDYLVFPVTCNGKPMAFVHAPTGYAASVTRVIQKTSTTYDIYVYIPIYSQNLGLTYSDVELYLFSDGNYTSSSSGYGIQIFKSDGEVAYDTGYSHLKVKVYGSQTLNNWVIVGTNEALNFAYDDYVYNKTRGNAAICHSTPYGDVIEVFTSPTNPSANWQTGDQLATTEGGATVATIGSAFGGVTQSQSLAQIAPIGTTWSAAGISKPAIFAYRQEQAVYTYQSGYYGGSPKYWHYYARGSIALSSDGFLWGLYPTRNVGTTVAEAEAQCAIGVGYSGYYQFNPLSFCSCNATGCTISQLAANYYGCASQVNWSQKAADIIALAIDGADYD